VTGLSGAGKFEATVLHSGVKELNRLFSRLNELLQRLETADSVPTVDIHAELAAHRDELQYYVYDALAARYDIICRAALQPASEREAYTTAATTHAFGAPNILPVYSSYTNTFNDERSRLQQKWNMQALVGKGAAPLPTPGGAPKPVVGGGRGGGLGGRGAGGGGRGGGAGGRGGGAPNDY
jgi:hypothetical protein